MGGDGCRAPAQAEGTITAACRGEALRKSGSDLDRATVAAGGVVFHVRLLWQKLCYLPHGPLGRRGRFLATRGMRLAL